MRFRATIEVVFFVTGDLPQAAMALTQAVRQIDTDPRQQSAPYVSTVQRADITYIETADEDHD